MRVYTDINDFKPSEKIVLTVGTFDGVHVGHQTILKRLQEIALKSGGETALLTFYPHPRMVLYPDDDSIKLITTVEEKIKLMDSFGLDHLIIVPFSKEFSKQTPTDYVRDILVNKMNIKSIVIGYDHRFGRHREGNIDLLEELGPVYDFSVEQITAQEINDIAISSTKIRRALSEGEFNIANKYLGHSYKLTGEVVEGEKIGRSIGFPTANIKPEDRRKLIPAEGVYAVKVNLENHIFQGMLNIGSRPTVSSENQITIEVHIFDFDTDIYGTNIEIEFVAKMRNESKLNGLAALQKQLELDKEMAISILNQ